MTLLAFGKRKSVGILLATGTIMMARLTNQGGLHSRGCWSFVLYPRGASDELVIVKVVGRQELVEVFLEETFIEKVGGSGPEEASWNDHDLRADIRRLGDKNSNKQLIQP